VILYRIAPARANMWAQDQEKTFHRTPQAPAITVKRISRDQAAHCDHDHHQPEKRRSQLSASRKTASPCGRAISAATYRCSPIPMARIACHPPRMASIHTRTQVMNQPEQADHVQRQTEAYNQRNRRQASHRYPPPTQEAVPRLRTKTSIPHPPATNPCQPGADKQIQTSVSVRRACGSDRP